MGGGKGGGSTGTTVQNSTVSIPPEVLARYNSVNATAENVAQNPFQPYGGEFVAPINATQQGGINNITGAQGWIPGTYNNTVSSIGAGVNAAWPQYNAASGNIQAGLAGGAGANQAALGQYGAALGAAQPYNTVAGGLYGGAGGSLGTAAGLAGAGTGAVNPSALDANAIGQYMSPYNQAVVNSTMALLGQQQQQQQMGLTTQQILGGSFGGDRSGIDRAVLSGQQNLASANVLSNLYNQNYGQALSAAQQQQGVGLGAAQANRAALQQGAGQFMGIGQATQGLGQAVQGLGQQVYGQGTGQAAFTGQIGQQGYQQALGAAGAQTGLGQAEFGTGLAAGQAYGQAGGQALQSQLAQGQAQLGAGTVEQQTQQAMDQAQYNQFLQGQAYPFQTTQFLANIAEGTGALSGTSTNANNFTPQPFFSDRKLKENIKTIAHTKSGLPIVQYNYKGSPHTQIGLIAQDVEKIRPEAVGLSHGYKTVDYERALRAAGGAAGLAGGGPAMVIYHIGGSVGPEDAGRGYADGGSPTMDPVALAQMLAMHQAMYPGAAGRPGMDSGPRGLQLHQPNSRALMKAELIKPPAQSQQTGAQSAMRDVNDLAGAGKSAGQIYSMGKDAVVGTPAKGTPGTQSYTPESGGLAGSGGSWDPQNGWFGKLGLGAANTNTPPVTQTALPDITPPPPVDNAISNASSDTGKAVADAATDTGAQVADTGDLISDALESAWAWRGGRQGRADGGFNTYVPPSLPPPTPSLVDIGDFGLNQALLKQPDPTKPAVGPFPSPYKPPGTPPPPVTDTSADRSPWMRAAGISETGGSANGATGDSSGGMGEAGSVGAGVGTAAGTAAATAVDSAGMNSEGPGPGSEGVGEAGSGEAWKKGGAVERALMLARRSKRYASGGMPYGDAGDGYIPDELYDPINTADLAKEQKGMEAPLQQQQKSGSGGGGDSTASDIASTALKLAPLALMLLKRGGRAGYADGGGGSDDDLPPYVEPDSNVIPFPDRGLGAARNVDTLPPFRAGSTGEAGPRSLGDIDVIRARNPKAEEGLALPRREPPPPPPPPPSTEPADPAAEVRAAALAEPPPPTPGLGAATPPPPPPPAAAAPAPAPVVPGLASPTNVSVPPGFTQPGMRAPDVHANILTRESGNQHWDPDGQPKRGKAGEVGIGQIMPGTGPIAARDAGLPWNPELFYRPKTGDPVKDKEAEDYGRALSSGHFKALTAKYGGDETKAAAAYNAGAGAVDKAIARSGGNWLNDPALLNSHREYVAGVTGQGGGTRDTAVALNAPATGGLGGGAAGPGLGQPTAPKDFLDRAGDWYDRNEKRIIPALAFLGNMLASPSRTLAGSIGSGLAGGANALAAQQGIGQGQQRIDITKNAQYISLWSQLRQMYAASITASKDGRGDPVIKAQMDRIAGLISGPAAPGSENQPAGAIPSTDGSALQTGVPTAPAPLPAPPAPAPPVTAPAAPVTPNPNATPSTASLPPSEQRLKPDYTPEFLAALAPNANPIALRRQAEALANAGNAALANQKFAEANAAEVKIQETGMGLGENGPIPAPNAEALKVSQARVLENAKWQADQAPVAVQRQMTRNNMEHIARIVENFEPGALAAFKADVARYVPGVTGIPVPSGVNMNPADYQAFVKAAAAVISNAPTGDHNTDAARATIRESFAHPDQEPAAVRKNLATALGQLDYQDEIYKDKLERMQRSPWLNQGLHVGEFTGKNPVESYVEKRHKDIAVKGDVPEKITPQDAGRAYILAPADVLKLVPKDAKNSEGKPLTLNDIRNDPDLGFNGGNGHGRFRIKVINGKLTPVRENGR